jgi:hypothetical protein
MLVLRYCIFCCLNTVGILVFIVVEMRKQGYSTVQYSIVELYGTERYRHGNDNIVQYVPGSSTCRRCFLFCLRKQVYCTVKTPERQHTVVTGLVLDLYRSFFILLAFSIVAPEIGCSTYL